MPTVADQYREISRVVGLFRAAYTEYEGKPADSWAEKTTFPWCSTLSANELAEFYDEMGTLLLSSVVLDHIEISDLKHALNSWKEKADSYRTPQELEDLYGAAGELVDADTKEGEGVKSEDSSLFPDSTSNFDSAPLPDAEPVLDYVDASWYETERY
jgi:hypothetical protein